MLWDAKNGALDLGNGRMEYIRFGRGARTLIMLPGLGDSLRSMKGAALPMAAMYRSFAKDFTVYVFGRKYPLENGCTTRDMAFDQARAMELLGISRADIFGVSMGGMVAQWLAVDHPERVGRLVLAVTAAEQNPILRESVEEWVALAKKGDAAGFMVSNLRRMYSEEYCRKNLWMAPILGRLTKPKSYDRFYIQAAACLTHDAMAHLGEIKAPTLVIGADRDMALGGEASKQIAAAIPGAKLQYYRKWGHAVYEEEKTFNPTVLEFIK